MTKSPTAAFLTIVIENSGLTDRVIAQRAESAEPNVLSMMKTGEAGEGRRRARVEFP
ncbi:hypothetical protein [Aliiruegeria sabulilitoris]|uniref:hypothetical protein n=1 Tax=Aliiruegeria sabulilitoris TaxID=1510458 RepID=UPI0012E380F7|nr:hypothetical protein [Aliiruegeria sabulilitoris]